MSWNPAPVQKSAEVTGTGNSLVISMSAMAQGNLAVVHICVGYNETVTSVVDDKGNTYVVPVGVIQGTSIHGYQAYGVQVVGGATTITVNFSASTTAKAAAADEFSPGAVKWASNADAVDTQTGRGGTGTTLNLASPLALAVAGELVVVSGLLLAAKTWTGGANYTLYNGSSGSHQVASEYRLSATRSENPSLTIATTTWVIQVRGFKPPNAAYTRSVSGAVASSPGGMY